MKRRFLFFIFLMAILLTTSFAVSSQDDDFEFIDDPSFRTDDEFEFIDDPSFSTDDEFEFIDDPSFSTDDDLELIDDPSLITEDDLALMVETIDETEIQSDEETDDDETVDDPDKIPEPDELLRVADERYFLRVGNSQTFSQRRNSFNEFLGYDVIHQYYVNDGKGTDILMSMFPSEVNVFTSNPHLNWKDFLGKDYHISVTMLLREDIPSGSGGCWLRYTNVQTKGNGGESGLILFPGHEAYAISPVGNRSDLNYTMVEDLTELNPHEMITFDFIRLDGVSYIYANGTFLFSYVDGFVGNMSFEGGAELYQDGNFVHCDFDDFTMRYR